MPKQRKTTATQSTQRSSPTSLQRPPVSQMSDEELHAWIHAIRAALHKKMARERNYLDRRARQSTHTPTDEAYEADQGLLVDLIALLNEMEASMSQGDEGMKDETIFTLVPSTNRGRYALDDPQTGLDLTSGESLALLLGGQWIPGRVEHGSSLYASEWSGQMEQGYYFIDSNGQRCGLCTGMNVRLP